MNLKSKIIRAVVGIEGGYSDNSDDPGGKTQYGITERVARDYGYNGPMRDLPKDLAEEIYAKEYWDLLSLDGVVQYSPSIAFELFDSGVNAGIGRSGLWLQQVLNQFNRQGRDYDDLIEDGKIGQKTIAALYSLQAKRGDLAKVIVWRGLNVLQGAHYISLPERFESFKVGWFSHRVGELPDFIKEGE